MYFVFLNFLYKYLYFAGSYFVLLNFCINICTVQAVFIDTYYKEEDPMELKAFNQNTNELFKYVEIFQIWQMFKIFLSSYFTFFSQGLPTQASHLPVRTSK